MEDFLWELFKMTGDVRYYVLLKNIENGGEDANKEDQRNSI